MAIHTLRIRPDMKPPTIVHAYVWVEALIGREPSVAVTFPSPAPIIVQSFRAQLTASLGLRRLTRTSFPWRPLIGLASTDPPRAPPQLHTCARAGLEGWRERLVQIFLLAFQATTCPLFRSLLASMPPNDGDDRGRPRDGPTLTVVRSEW